MTTLVGVSLGARANQHAVCSNTDFSWSFNSFKQSPCQIGEALGNQCTSDGSFNIQPIPSRFHYAGIATTAATNCVCNHVYWSLLNICAACQGAIVDAFPLWSQNCLNYTFNSYPNAIPNDTAVPHYAYLPLLIDDTFDFKGALADHGAEATPPFTSQTSSPSLTSSESSQSPSTSSVSSSGGGSSNNTGPIAGSVIALTLIATGILFFLKRRKRNLAEPVMDVDDDGEGAVHPYCYQQVGSLSEMAQRVYNPNDAATFQASTTPPPYTSIAERTTRAHKPGVRP